MVSFQEKHDNKFSIRWDEKAGLPKSIRGHRISDYSGTPLEIAKQFLKNEKVMFGIESVDQDLVLKHIRKMSNGGDRVYFTQKYKDVKLLNTGYLVIIDAKGAIYYVTGDYYPEVNLKTVEPLQSPEIVKSLIQDDLSTQNGESISDPELFILPEVDGKTQTYTLVYQTTALVSNPTEHWEYTIDAMDGTVLKKKSLSCDINGTGRVYLTDPDDCNYSTETIYRLDNLSPRRLQGDNAHAYNYDGAEATSSTATFIYLPSHTHFDEVMAYYHCDMFELFLINLGMSTSQLDNDIEISVHDPSYYARTFYIVRQMYLNDEHPDYDFLDPAKDAGLIAHEYMHCVTWTYCNMDDNLEELSMNEALSDYFGVAYYNEESTTSWIGRYVDDDDTYEIQRNLDNSYHYDDFGTIEYDQFEGSGSHDNSLIYSGALWEFRSDANTDAETVDEIVLVSLEYLDDIVDFQEGREAIEDAAIEEGYSSYLDDLSVAFHAHGIGNGTPSVTISGPGYLAFKASAICTANVSGGNSPINYQWYKKIGQGSWISLGTSSTQSITMGMDDITMKVVVTDNYGLTDEDTHLIETGLFKPAAGEEATLSIPDNHIVAQNYPNPFNPETRIRFGLPEDSKVTIEVFNLQGRKVATLANGYYEAGYHSVTFSGANHPSGVYFYRTVSGDFQDIKRMLLIK